MTDWGCGIGHDRYRAAHGHAQLRALLLASSALFSLGLSQQAEAGAWPRAKEETLLISTLAITGAPNRLTASGRPHGGAGFEKTELAAYLETGWRDSTTLISRLAWQDTISGGDRQRGFSSLDLGARTRLWQFESGTVISAQATILLPLREHRPGNPLLSSGHADYDLRLLQGEPEGILWLPGFTDSQLAYRHRGGKAPDEIRLDLTYGIPLSDDWLVLLQGETTVTVGKAEAPFSHYRSQKGIASLRWTFAHGRHVQLGAIQTLSGAEIVRESGALVSFWAEF